MKWILGILSGFLLCGFLLCGPAYGQADSAGQGAASAASTASAASQNEMQHWNLLQTDIYSIRYPPDWTANTTGLGGTSFALFAPAASHKAVFRQNINLVIKDVSADTVTLEELTNVNLEMLKAAFSNFSVISAKRLKDTIGEYQQMVYEFQQQGYFLRQLQEYRIIGGKAYYLTFTSLRSRYDTYMDVVGEVFGSFRLR
jgi:hypothetical protein